MSDEKLITFPRGFRSDKKNYLQDEVPEFFVDQEVEKLFRSYMSNEVDFNQWEFKVALFEEMYRLFGLNFEEWVLSQINTNTSLYDHNFEFLIDTLNYINGKPRKCSPLVWRELMVTNPEGKSSTEIANRKVPSLKKLYPTLKEPIKTTDAISMWCSRENGFQDMLESVWIFFGSATQENNALIQGMKML